MKYISTALAIITLCTVVISAPAQAQSDDVEPAFFNGIIEVSGTVRDTAGNPIAGVSVGSQVTDASGTYYIAGENRNDIDSITVMAYKDGYVFSPPKYVLPTPGSLESHSFSDKDFIGTPLASPTNNVKISSTSGGSTSENGTLEVDRGNSLSVTATPNDGYVFLGWAGDSTSKNTDITLNNIQSDKELLAIFSKEGTGALAGNICDAGSGAWRIFGEKNWRTGLEGANNLDPGLYLVEFRNVNGKRSPDYFSFTVTEDGLIRHEGCYTDLLPIIHYFTADPEYVGAGGETTINWLVSKSNSREIDNGLGPVSPKGTMDVDVLQNLTLNLEAINNNGSNQQELVINKNDPLKLIAFFASANAVRQNGVVELTWQVQGASKLTINGKNIPDPTGIGTQKFKVTEDTDFTLVAENGLGDAVEAVIPVTISAASTIVEDDLQPAASHADLEAEIVSATASSEAVNIIDLVVTVKNSGDTPAKFIELMIYEDLKNLRHTETIRRLGPGQELELELSYVTPKNGSRRIDAWIDADNEIAEEMEGNNRDKLRIRQSLWPGADLVLTNVRITPGPDGASNIYRLRADIVNAGKGKSDGFQYSLFTSRLLFKTEVNRKDIVTAEVPELKAGEAHSIDLLINLSSYTNIFYLQGRVDTLDAIQETNEENNEIGYLFRKKWIN